MELKGTLVKAFFFFLKHQLYRKSCIRCELQLVSGSAV